MRLLDRQRNGHALFHIWEDLRLHTILNYRLDMSYMQYINVICIWAARSCIFRDFMVEMAMSSRRKSFPVLYLSASCGFHV